MFRSAHILVPLYDAISRQAVLAADAPRVAGFLGKKISPTLAQEIGSRLSTRIEGRCIKHYMGAAGVKSTATANSCGFCSAMPAVPTRCW